MEPHLLDLPLGVKIPVLPGSKPVYSRAKLGEKLQRPSGYFDLGDPYCRLLRTEYNSLHDPHLREYHKRKGNIQRLKREGYITSDGRVVCTLKEFNEYRQYLTALKQNAENMIRREQEGLERLLAQLQGTFKLLGATESSRLAEQLLQPQKPSCPPPRKSRKTSLESGRCRRMKAPLGERQTYYQAERGREGAKVPRRVSSDVDWKGKREDTADRVFKAALKRLAAAEAQALEEVAESVVQEALEMAKATRDLSASVLRKVAMQIRGSLCSSTQRAEPSGTSAPDRWQETELLAKELVATVLDTLGKCLASSTSEAPEPRPAARRKEQPVARGASRAGKSKEHRLGQAETAESLQASLDKLTSEVLDCVCCTLESFAASHLEQDSSCTYSQILELPEGHLSKGQQQPSQTPLSRQRMEERQQFRRASKQQSREASKGAKVPVLQPAPNTTTKPKPKAYANTLDIRTMASQIVDSVLEKICQPGPAPTLKPHFGRCVAKPRPHDEKQRKAVPLRMASLPRAHGFPDSPPLQQVRRSQPRQEHGMHRRA